MQDWVANQVGELVSAATRGECFDPGVMKAAMRRIAISRWGSLNATARFFGINDRSFHYGFESGRRFGLQFLLALSSSTGVNALDILRGKTTPAVVSPKERYKIQERWSPRKPRDLSQGEVAELMLSDPSLSLANLVSRAGVSEEWFRSHYPREAAEVAARYRARRKRSGWRRLLAKGRIMREAAVYLEQIGLTFNKINIEKYFGLSIWWDKDEELYVRMRCKLDQKQGFTKQLKR
ncbi:hypothetical protein [Paraburkholderia sp. SIMBA_054]|jgi:hypothetical protein|uniref:hypothetical protein n=1 Tax=Paraburkholderia TaxID=1822464 RepID=UPI00397C5653